MNTLIIITDFDFDIQSGAGFSRMENYSKALSSAGRRVIWISSRYNYQEPIKVLRKEHYIAFISESKINYQSTFSSLHFRRIKQFLKETIVALKQEVKDINSVPFLIYSSNLPMVWHAFFYLKKRLNFKVYIEKNELQTAIAINKPVRSTNVLKSTILVLFKPINIFMGFIADVLAIWFDGIIVISTNFEKTYKRFQRNIIKIPILVNNALINRNSPIINRNYDSFLIGYFGWVGESKNGIFSLIAALKKHNNFKSSKLKLIIFGPGPKMSILKLKEMCNQDKNIIYEGNLMNKEVAGKLIEFNLLAFPRPLNLQTKYGFSTKLAEFMISGVPVLTTDVSDNKEYIKDGVNGFLIQSSRKININILAEKLDGIVSLKSKALSQIGSKGKETAIQYFNPFHYSEKLSNFLA